MFLTFLSPFAPPRSFSLLSHSRTIYAYKSIPNLHMDPQISCSISQTKRTAHFRLTDVSGHKADLLEIHAEHPILHVLFIPGNPGVISFYTDFLESLYELFGGTASITAIGQISHMGKDWERGRLFSLEEQNDHKMKFIKQELENIEVPIVLVAHSIGCHISIELLRRSSAKNSIVCAALSSIVALLGLLPSKVTRFLVKNSLGKSWSSTAVNALCDNLLQYHAMQNVFFMARTEFIKLLEPPDWQFLREKQSQIAFLFGDDDHWGPLHMCEEASCWSTLNRSTSECCTRQVATPTNEKEYIDTIDKLNSFRPPLPLHRWYTCKENESVTFNPFQMGKTLGDVVDAIYFLISKQCPNVRLAIARESHTHAFSCTDKGSLWVAEHVASLIKKQTST